MILRNMLVTLGGISPLFMLLLSCGTAGQQPSIVLIIIDTLRADHLSCYGYERNTSPVIDSLANSGILWEYASAQASWTLPATSSIWTGLTSRAHGARMDVSTGEVFGLDPAMPVLPMILKGRGYRTAGFFNVYLLSADFGFHRGFDTFDCRENGDGMAAETVDDAISWLEEVKQDGPFFLAVHLFDVHDPYDPPEPFDRLFSPEGTLGETAWEVTPEGAVARPQQCDHLERLYDGEISWVDSELGRLLSELRNLGLSDNTLVVLTADHGEEFLEHGYFGHGRTLYQETVHVPLIMSGPGIDAGVVNPGVVGQYDILPSIMDYCGIPVPEGVEGISILGSEPLDERSVPASGINTGTYFNQASVTNGSSKLIWNADTDSSEMYDLISDPDEQNPIPPDSVLLEEVLYYWSTPCSWNPGPIEAWRVAPVLRDLGYIR